MELTYNDEIREAMEIEASAELETLSSLGLLLLRGLALRCRTRPKVLTVEDKLAVLQCKDLERRIVEAEMELTLAKSQGYLKNRLPQSGSSSDRKLLAVIGVYTGFGSRLKRNVFRGSWMPRGDALKKLEERGVVIRFVIGREGLIGILEHRRGQDSSYMGCMKSGDVITEEGRQWYEPEWWKFGDEKCYFRHAAGALIILSKNLAQYININSGHPIIIIGGAVALQYNEQKKELFKPKVDGKVGMYVCGVTAYDLSHIGHARVYVTFDVLYRYLRHLGFEVCYVRNFTDVDDKIIARANELREDPISLSRRYCEEFHHDMVYLHCLHPSVEPHKFPEYGQLSGRKLEDNRAGERVAVDSRKKNPADFALWKSAKEGEPFWESPWGPGRPGWHIECSAMSAAYLGHSFDIHGGGMDLVFPHHENEIAQSCAACRDSSISYWIHNGFVTVIDLYHPLALRLFLLGTHYRSPINYSNVQLESASERIFYIYQTLHDCETVISQHDMAFEKDSVPPDTLDGINRFHNVFVASMSDDLHTPVLLAALSDPLKIINDMIHTRKGKKQAKRIESLAALEKIVKNALCVLGLMPTTYSEVLQQMREKSLRRAKLTEDQVLQKIEERNVARKNRDYEKSDAIRKDLATLGIALMDSPDGTSWRPAIPLALQEQQVAAT
ncbi:hypothetical protein GH714_039438 [Hevea brasiliensis]|uniref:cysteine--tRNA ligase n=1 Tax=Hevea brasiliensis TaxID=3981 RepID=A0A6A6KEM1_HEVBR|nr:hypothetical protein GH714_039438 [Hevea brasiliensis]